MLFSIHNSLPEIFNIVKNELEKGPLDPIHPFRFVPLATHIHKEIELRYVVFRRLDEDLNFYFFTDSRSGKIAQLTVNPEIALLFYHDKKRVQVRVKGLAQIHHQDELTAHYWSKLSAESQKAYTAELYPGGFIDSPKLAYQWDNNIGEANFVVLKVKPISIEALQLNGLEHIRVYFFNDRGNWKMNWMSP